MAALNVVELNAPSLEYTGAVGGIGDKRFFSLEDLAPIYDGFPADAEIIYSSLWSQQADEHPAGCFGEISWAVDRGIYSKLAKVPALEKCQPFALGQLGRLMFRPGADVMDRMDHPVPLIYRPGYKIMACFEVGNALGRKFSIFPMMRVRSATGFTPLDGVVYHDLLNASVPAGTPAFSYRSRFSDISEGGTEVRVTVQTLWDGGAATHMSIGVQSGATWNMTAAPVQLSFEGASGFSQTGMKTLRSAWAPLVTTAACNLLVHSCIPAGPHGYKSAFDDSCYVWGLSGHDTAAFSGTMQPKLTHGVAMIEVR